MKNNSTVNVDSLSKAIKVSNKVTFLKQNLADKLPFKDVRFEHQIANSQYLIKILCSVYPDGYWINESNDFLLKVVKKMINNKCFW